MWWPFWKWRPVEIFRCQESIRDIIIYLHMKCRWNRTMLNLCGIVAVILKMTTGRNFPMSGHHYLPTYQILMISDNVESLRSFWKWRHQSIRKSHIAKNRNWSVSKVRNHNLPTYEMSLKSDNVEFVRYCGSHFEMATARKFSMLGIYSGHHNLPTYEMSLKSDNVEFVRYCGGYFENGDR